MENKKILVVEDDLVVAADLEERLNGFGYTVCSIASSGEEAVRSALELRPDLVMMDIRLKSAMDGIDAAEKIHQRCCIPVVYLTAFADMETLKRAKLTEPFGYVLKPFEDRTLQASIELAFYRHTLDSRLRTLNFIGQQINSSLSQETVVRTAVNLIAENVCHDFVALFLKEGEQLLLKNCISDNLRFSEESSPVTRVGECLCGLAVSQGKPVFSLDTQSDPRCTREECKRAGLRSSAALPLWSTSSILGVLGIASTRPRDFSKEADFLESISNHVAIGLQNSLLYQSVIKQRKEIRNFALQLEEVRESGRRRLAQELHDRVGQNLTALNLSIGIVQSKLSAESAEKVGGRLVDCMKMVEETTDLVRDVMAKLRPPVLDDHGLTAALHWLAEQFFERTGVKVTVDAEELSARLPSNVETALFRIVQEALTNVAKHADATQVTVTLLSKGRDLRTTIMDNGTGFDSESALSAGQQRLGLIGMRERASGVGGKLVITSKPGEGTCISVDVRR
jgi:two-component system sensor histidine kinase UhpB